MGFYRETAFYSFHLQWERQLVKERRYTALIIIIKKNMMHLHIPSLSIFQHCYSIYCSLTVVVIIFFSFHINNSFYLIILHFPCSFIYYLHFLPSVLDREKKINKNLVKSVFTYIAKFVTWFNVMEFLFRYNISQTNFLRIVWIINKVI